MYEYNSKIPFIICFICVLLSVVLAINLENIKEESAYDSVQNEYNKYLCVVKNGFKQIINDKKIVWLMIYSSLTSLVLVSLMSTYQLWFMKLEISTKYFGWIYFVLYLISALGSKCAHWFCKSNLYKCLYFLLILLCITALLMAPQNIILILCIILPRIVIGVYPVILKEFMNREIQADRATIFSIRSLLMRLGQVLFLPIIGIVIDGYGLNYAFLLIVFIISVSIVGLKLFQRFFIK